MVFKARYIHRRQEAPEYWRTIHADTLNQAVTLAEKYTRKGYILCNLSS
jgi:hypothetical protein